MRNYLEEDLQGKKNKRLQGTMKKNTENLEKFIPNWSCCCKQLINGEKGFKEEIKVVHNFLS